MGSGWRAAAVLMARGDGRARSLNEVVVPAGMQRKISEGERSRCGDPGARLARGPFLRRQNLCTGARAG